MRIRPTHQTPPFAKFIIAPVTFFEATPEPHSEIRWHSVLTGPPSLNLRHGLGTLREPGRGLRACAGGRGNSRMALNSI